MAELDYRGLAEDLRVCLEKRNLGLRNCRMYAAMHRKESWAKEILRFCTEAGITASPLRDGQSGERIP